MRHVDNIMIEQQVTESFLTKNGELVFVRPLMPEDAPYLVDLFENMGSESRYNRFMQPADQVNIDRIWTEAEKIAQSVNSTSYGLVAFVDLPERADVPVAGSRYVRLSAVQAEIAVSVRDDMQNKGIGTELLRLLIEHAGAYGIDQVVGTVQNSNSAMWAMLKNLPYRLERQSEGSYSLITLHIHEPDSRTGDWLDTAADFSPEPQIIW